MEMIQLELRLAINDLDVELARNDTLPRLDLDYTYVAAGQAEHDTPRPQQYSRPSRRGPFGWPVGRRAAGQPCRPGPAAAGQAERIRK